MNIQSVQFHNQEIQVLNYKGKPYVAMKPIVENIGLDWASQYRRIKNHSVLAQGVVMMTIPSKGGEQDVVSLPLGMLNGWLFGIDIKRVKPEIRETLKLYQMECFDVLYKHFLPVVANDHPNTINLEQQQEIKSLVNTLSKKTGRHYQFIYNRLYEEFKIPRYQELPTSRFLDAVEFLKKELGDHNFITPDSRRYLISIKIRDNLFGGHGININAAAHDTNAIITNFAKELGYKIHSMSKVADAFENRYTRH